MKRSTLILRALPGPLILFFVLMALPARAAGEARNAAPAAADGDRMSEGDGPPINLTCVGVEVPATVHVYALAPQGGAQAGESPAAQQRPAGGITGEGDPSPLAHSYAWDFGDPEGRYNQLPGWNAAHVYDKPGKYTITLTVTDEAGKAVRRTTWVRMAPETRRKIYCSAAGRDELDGASPARAVRTAWRAAQLAQHDAVVFFRRGDRFDVSRQIGVNGRNVRFTGYDDTTQHVFGPPGAPRPGDAPPGEAPASGADDQLPVLNKVQAQDGQDPIFIVNPRSSDVTFDGLAFDSQWDITQSAWQKIPARAINAAGTNCTVRNCTFRNLTDGVNAELKPTGLLVQDCRFSNEIRGYGIYGCGSDHAYVGNSMLHSRTEHLIRVTEPGVTRLLIAHNDLYRPNNGKGSIELRNANWFYVSDNVINGGTVRVGPQEQDQHQFPNWAQIKCTWGVVQNNRLDDVFVNVRLGTEHVAVRNNLIHLRGDKEGDWAFFVACSKPGFDAVRKVIDLRIERNTVVNDGPIGQFIVVEGHPLSVTLRDNLFVAPRLRTTGDRGWSVFSFDKDLSGFAKVAGDVWPAGPGGLHHWAKADHGRDDWAQSPQVSGERYENVALDADGNPPPGLNAGARLAKKPAPHHARGNGPWDEMPRHDGPDAPAATSGKPAGTK